MLASGFSPAVPSMSESTIAKNVIPASCGGRIFGAAPLRFFAVLWREHP
jgi:hypothetical protein